MNNLTSVYIVITNICSKQGVSPAMLGINSTTNSQYREGIKIPSYKTLGKILAEAEKLGVPIQELYKSVGIIKDINDLRSTKSRKTKYTTIEERKIAAQAYNKKYRRQNVKTYTFTFYNSSDKAVIDKLNSQSNKVDYVRQLILKDINS